MIFPSRHVLAVEGRCCVALAALEDQMSRNGGLGAPLRHSRIMTQSPGKHLTASACVRVPRYQYLQYVPGRASPIKPRL